MLRNVHDSHDSRISSLVSLLCLSLWIPFDLETIACICKHTINSTRGKKNPAVMYQILVKAWGGLMTWGPPLFLSSWCKPTEGMWMWGEEKTHKKTVCVWRESVRSPKKKKKNVMPEREWGVCNRVPGVGDLAITCLVVGRLLRGSGWPTPRSWSNSHILVNVCSALLLWKKMTLFPYVYSKICYYKFYVLYKYWFVCSF